jgi:hypothetical protein
MITGAVFTLVDIIDFFLPSFILALASNHLFSGLLSFIIFSIGYERIIQKRKIEDKISFDFLKLFSHIEELKGVEIISSTSGITMESINAIKEAEYKIRVTNFKPVNPNGNNDTETIYYDALVEKLRNSNVRYECALHVHADNTNREAAINKISNPANKEIIKSKMLFFEYVKEQRPLNLIIVDHKYAFIGFYTHKGDLHMETVIKISSASETGRVFINRLTLWYDSFIKPEEKSDTEISVYNGIMYFTNKIKTKQQ